MIAMRDIKSRQLREKDPNINTKLCFEVRATALRPRFHIEGFQLSTKDPPQRDFHGGITPSTNKEYTTPTLTPLHKREDTKSSTKQRENYNLVIA